MGRARVGGREPLAERVQPADLRVSIRSQGTVRPRTESTLVPQVSGVITWVSNSWASGGFFARDEVLLKIDPTDYELAKAKAEASVAQAGLRLAREEQEADVARREWENLLKTDPTMARKASPLLLRDPQVAEAKAALNAAGAALEKARLDISRTEIRAVFAGRPKRAGALDSSRQAWTGGTDPAAGQITDVEGVDGRALHGFYL